MLLELEKLAKSFGGLRAVDGVSFQVEQGKLSSIIGPNGSGKTTLFNLITGHLRLDSGRVIFRGEDITKLSPSEICRRGMGRSFQRTNIFPELSVFENVQVAVLAGQGKTSNIFSRAKSMVREETEEILGAVGLGDKRATTAGFLAHGDQRRLELGIALAGQPTLLLLDEPTAGMSPEETVATTDLIERLNKERGITLIFVEHDMSVVFGISDSITVMHMGRIIAAGSPEDVKANDEVQRVYLGEEA